MKKNFYEGYVAPGRVFGNLYFVGTAPASTHVIATEEGLIVIDPGYPEALETVLANMRTVGLDPMQTRIILCSHGHYDHAGAVLALRDMTGAKTYIGYGDEDSVSGKNDLQWTKEFNMSFDCAFTPDVILHDGDRLTIGNREFLFLSTPGHTRGVLTFFFNVTDRGREYRAGMFGGGGFNSMALSYLDKYGLPHSLRDDFLASIDRVMEERVEVHLGNHLGDNEQFDKLARLGGEENPFVDTTTWKKLLVSRRASAVEYFKTK